MIYDDYKRNHVILPGREKALENFLRQDCPGIGPHKWENGFNSHSEDALSWSCFDLLRSFPMSKKISILDEIFEDAYQGKSKLLLKNSCFQEDEIQIHIGKQYTGLTSKEKTEVDASIELPGKLIFFEAKLYSTVSMASPPDKPFDQIARKLRIGLDSPLQDEREFYFIFLDIAPLEKLTRRKNKSVALAPVNKGFEDKWKSAWLFKYYKSGRNNSLRPLKEALINIPSAQSIESIAENMGWLTWSDLFKSILRGMIAV
jgi:hypothetical protein